jgi:hypothetical protein
VKGLFLGIKPDLFLAFRGFSPFGGINVEKEPG